MRPLSDVHEVISTGSLPEQDLIGKLLSEAYDKSKDNVDGNTADYIEILDKADTSIFGMSVVPIDGSIHNIGDALHTFSIQSISKAFVYALVCQELGHEKVSDRIGVNNTGMPFNSVMAIELNNGHPMNPMVNAGAIATASLVPGDTPEDKWSFIDEGLAAFAGHPLKVDETVFEQEVLSGDRNSAIGLLLKSYNRIDSDPLEAVRLYTRQCCFSVTAQDLAVMGATLAGGGINPVTGDRVVDAWVCRDTLAVLATCGMYERSGEWLFEVGVPGKSGVSGGIVAVAPGKGALGTYSAALDSAGNSVRGMLAARYLSKSMGLNIFASQPKAI